jgi:hypothetical protein
MILNPYAILMSFVTILVCDYAECHFAECRSIAFEGKLIGWMDAKLSNF